MDRPKVCKEYRCEWLDSEDFPLWMKPSLSGVMVSKVIEKGLTIYNVTGTPELSLSSLNFLFLWSLRNRVNIRYFILGGEWKVGFDPAFLQNSI